MAVVTLITPMGLSANPYLAAYGSSLVFALLFGITGQIQNDSRKVGFGQTLLLASPVVLWVAMALIWEMWKWYHHRDW